MSTRLAFTTTVRTDLVSPADLMSRARAAARLAMRGNGYSTEDRVDCAAHIVERTLEKVPSLPMSGDTDRKGSPAQVLAWIDRVWSGYLHPATHAASVPEQWATFSRMTGLAANYRRTLDRDRARDTADALETAATRSFIPAPGLSSDDPETRGSWRGAAETANAMLAATGLPSEGLWWNVAYAAARSATGMGAPDVASELAVSPATLRQHLTRFPARVPASPVVGFLPSHWHLALNTPDTATPAGHRTPMLRVDERTRPDHPAPITLRRTRTVRPWNGRKVAQWATQLPAGTDARLRRATEMKRARAQAADPAERASAKLAAGLPG